MAAKIAFHNTVQQSDIEIKLSVLIWMIPSTAATAEKAQQYLIINHNRNLVRTTRSAGIENKIEFQIMRSSYPSGLVS